MTGSRTVACVLALAACGKDAAKPTADEAEAPPAVAIPACGVAGTVQPVSGGAPAEPKRPAHTYSIVARDAATGDLGVAVQSHWFAVGAMVTWAEAGVGAVATQSFVDPRYGRLGIGRMRAGVPAPDALASLLKDDARPGIRQVAFVDAQGRVAAHTGDETIAYAGHQLGDGYAVQANIMANDQVVPAMARAFEAATGPLAERMLAALDAAQAAGGDLRGCQSAAMLVVKGGETDEPSRDELVDLRVDDHPSPLHELRRLLGVQRVYDHMNAGDVAVEQKDLAAAREHYTAAMQGMPDSDEIKFWAALTMAQSGDVDAALPIFREVFARDAAWIELTRRVQPAAVPKTAEGDALVEKILSAAP